MTALTRPRVGQTLSRSDILRRKQDLDRVRRRGTLIPGPVLSLRFSPNPQTGAAWSPGRNNGQRFAVLLTRGIRTAVLRNRLKRRLRELLRLSKHLLPPGHDYLLQARPEAARLDSAQLRAGFTNLVRKVADARIAD